MMKIEYIGTISRENWGGNTIRRLLGTLDVDWGIFGFEIGKSGYKHWQFAVRSSTDLESWVRNNNLGWHIEKCVSWEKSVKYCRKDGRYFFVGDPPTSEKFYSDYRRGKFALNGVQRQILRVLHTQNDRSISVWIDRSGSSGKSTVCYLETIAGNWLPVPRTDQNPVKIIDFVARWLDGEKTICVDLPRNKVLTPELCGALEDIKDGLISSGKYEGSRQFVRGIHVVVFTNNWIPKKAYESLSKDRWDIHVIGSEKGEYPPR